MNTYEPSKADKKILRKAIDIGIQYDKESAIADLDAVITQWKEKRIDYKEAYAELYDTLHKHDKHIAQMYDGLGGSRYLITVCVLYRDGKVTDDDLKGLEEGTMQRILAFKNF